MKVKIKDYEYTIVEVDDNDANFIKDNELVLYGQTLYTKQLIKIYKDLSPKRKRETLIHELTHAFYVLMKKIYVVFWLHIVRIY